MEDPNMGEEGEQFHKQYEMSQYRLDESSVPECDQLELAMRKMAEAVVAEWDQQSKYEHTALQFRELW